MNPEYDEVFRGEQYHDILKNTEKDAKSGAKLLEKMAILSLIFSREAHNYIQAGVSPFNGMFGGLFGEFDPKGVSQTYFEYCNLYGKEARNSFILGTESEKHFPIDIRPYLQDCSRLNRLD